MESVDNDKGFVEVSFATEGVKDRMKYVYRLPESEPGTGKIQVILTLSCRWSINRPPYFQISKSCKNI